MKENDELLLEVINYSKYSKMEIEDLINQLVKYSHEINSYYSKLDFTYNKRELVDLICMRLYCINNLLDKFREYFDFEIKKP